MQPEPFVQTLDGTIRGRVLANGGFCTHASSLLPGAHQVQTFLYLEVILGHITDQYTDRAYA